MDWRGRLVGAVMLLLGMLGYMADLIPYETKRHAAEVQVRHERELQALGETLAEVLRNQIRVLERLGMMPDRAGPRGHRR